MQYLLDSNICVYLMRKCNTKSDVLLEFAKQKALLRRKGLMVEDADIFIGATAIVNNLTMVTENLKHIGRLENIKIENWCS